MRKYVTSLNFVIFIATISNMTTVDTMRLCGSAGERWTLLKDLPPAEADYI